MPEKANAQPAKEFFIRMLTRDIPLEDCILDLLDNAVDGARAGRHDLEEGTLDGYWVAISLAADRFAIADNCGGIPLDAARNYAFNFGRPADAPPVDGDSIGIYGIGMKRALFKLGGDIHIRSSTTEASFETRINVAEWGGHDRWEFELEPGPPQEHPGTEIVVTDLNDGVGSELADPAFQRTLARDISRAYSIFLRSGLAVSLNDNQLVGQVFDLLVGADFVPVRYSYDDDGVVVEIIAGMAAPPPTDDSADAKLPHTYRYGWSVICNDRVVLAGDKTARTVWGNDGFNAWHNQYNGFLGIASFHSKENPAALPWTTTKRDLDLADPIYRRAIVRMKKATKPYLEYTNVRKDQEARVAELERATRAVRIDEVDENEEMKVPEMDPVPRVQWGNVLYRKKKVRLQNAAKALGNRSLTYKEIGSRTFEYFYEREVDET